MKKIAFVTLFLVGLTPAHASPFVEGGIQVFLNSPQASWEKIPVLLLFGQSADEKALLESGTSAQQVNERLQKINSRKVSALPEDIHARGLWVVNGALASVSLANVKELLTLPEIRGIYRSDKKYQLKKFEQTVVSADFTYGLKNIGVPELRQRFPLLTGKGVRVGILDTGLTPSHPDLKGRLKVFRNFSPSPDPGPADGFGHGTHVAGTIAGGQSGGVAIGVAPEADLIVARIFDGNGESTREKILEAMQWMADPDGNPSTADFAQVVNNSWSDDDPYNDRDPENEPLCAAVQTWVKLGMIPVFSAGNTGPSPGTINLPAGCPEAFSVAATEQSDRSPWFSSAGPAVWKSYRLAKPEVSAPGFQIKSASKDGGYEEMSGTSMAAPHVSGAFAILLQAFPRASAEEIKSAMLAGAKDLGEPSQDATFGWGRIDILKALDKLGGNQK